MEVIRKDGVIDIRYLKKGQKLGNNIKTWIIVFKMGDLIVGGKFKICKRIGEGSFGQVFAGINIKSREEVAIKLVSNSQH